MSYAKRFYRKSMGKRFISFTLKERETDLWIGINKESFSEKFIEIANEKVKKARNEIVGYALTHPEFYTSLLPLPYDSEAPETVKHMIKVSRKADVGPMAAVAGAIAEKVGRSLVEAGAREVVVENGGDIFVKIDKPIIVGIFSGKSPLNGKVLLRVEENETPCGICTSSATIGHSISFGAADAVTVISKDTALADGLATKYCNKVKSENDVNRVLKDFPSDAGGIVVIINDVLGSIGKNVHFVGGTI